MVIKKLLLLTIGFMLLLSGSALAHIAIPSKDGNGAIVLHITPDDDPIAGQQSSLYFGLGDDITTDNSTFVIQITDEFGQVSTPPVTLEDQTVSANFTFPKTGVYTVALQASKPQLGSRQLTALYSAAIRVDRGIGSTVSVSHPLAQGALIFSILILVVLLVLAFNNRRSIADHPPF